MSRLATCLNWTKVGLKVKSEAEYLANLGGLNWTKVGLKVSGSIPSVTSRSRLNWTKVGLKATKHGDICIAFPFRLNWTKVGLKEEFVNIRIYRADREFELD